MSRRGEVNRRKRAKNKPQIFTFCKDMGFAIVAINGDWHYRIEGVFDVFPTRKRWHYIPNDTRGGYKDYDHLGRILTEQIDQMGNS